MMSTLSFTKKWQWFLDEMRFRKNQTLEEIAYVYSDNWHALISWSDYWVQQDNDAYNGWCF